MSAAELAPTFAALGDPTRLSLVMTLSDGRARSIVTLSAGTRLSRQAVTKHLRVLSDSGLVRAERAGRESRFGLCPEPMRALTDYLNAVGRQWEGALERLRDFVEEPSSGAVAPALRTALKNLD